MLMRYFCVTDDANSSLGNQRMIIYKQFTFDAAHFLPKVPDGHKCRALHGHTYHLSVFISGAVLQDPWLGYGFQRAHGRLQAGTGAT
ncbi:6-pyruvoyl trahydropterin synthase family protein [Mucilaginibacter humi]